MRLTKQSISNNLVYCSPFDIGAIPIFSGKEEFAWRKTYGNLFIPIETNITNVKFNIGIHNDNLLYLEAR